jgi:hypothetical protein
MAATVEDVVGRLFAHGRDIRLLGRCGGGATGMAFDVDTPEGRRVLKWQRAGYGVSFERVATALDRLRPTGYPLPGYEVLDIGEDLDVSLQEPLPGKIMDELSDDLRNELLALIELQAGHGVAGEVSWVDMLCSITLDGAPDWCRHESLVAHSDATRDLWEYVERVILTLDRTTVPSGDIVHMDFHHRNVLQSGDRVCGVIDWEGAECGDRRFDVMTLAYYSGVAGWTSARRANWITDVATEIGESAGRLYVSHLAVRTVDWAIRHETEPEVQRWLNWAREALAAVD